MRLTAEELLAGGSLTYTVAVPPALLAAGAASAGDNGTTPVAPRGDAPAPAAAPSEARTVVLRPLTLADIQVIVKAAREDDLLTSALILQRTLVEPKLAAAQVIALPAGLVRFLVDEVNRISGLDLPGEALTGAVQAPLSRACFVLAREFGWTPQEVSEMTIGQILLYLEMLNGTGQPAEATR